MCIQITTPNHVRLISSCYPSSPLAAGPDYKPNTQELSRLTYYASNRPGKLNKLSNELERRAKVDARRAKFGNLKARASLLITLTIIKAMVTECRRDLSLFSRAVVASIEVTVSSLPTDLEVTSRAASVFTAWTTFTDGTLIGVDESLTTSYLATLAMFASLSVTQGVKGDGEVRNRTRLVGLATLTSVASSDALYNYTTQFQRQAAIIVPALVRNFEQAGLDSLQLELTSVEDSLSQSTPYLSEFQQRPVKERRAASIHVHIDGEKGPSNNDVVNASLRVAKTLVGHCNAVQAAHVLNSILDTLDEDGGWSDVEFCCWLSQCVTEWTQYQYRFAIPTKLIERLLDARDAPLPTPLHSSLTAMITTIFTSPTPLSNLSTSDILSNLITILLRRVAIDPQDGLIPALVKCIGSLGTHVYYSDQIQDLSEELASRLVGVQVKGLLGRGRVGNEKGREEGMRALLACLTLLVESADDKAHMQILGKEPTLDKAASKAENDALLQMSEKPASGSRQRDGEKRRDGETAAAAVRHGRRNPVSTEVWQETLALLCESEYGVRSDYARALLLYLRKELPKEPWAMDEAGKELHVTERLKSVPERPHVHISDPTSRFLNALHASAFTLAVSSSLGLASNRSPSASSHNSSQALSSPTPLPVVNIIAPSPGGTPGAEETMAAATGTAEGSVNAPARRSTPSNSNAHTRQRKGSLALSLLDPASGQFSSAAPCPASPYDYANLLTILTTVHKVLPVRAALTGVPMLLALDAVTRSQSDTDGQSGHARRRATREVVANVWAEIGKVWSCPEVEEVAKAALASLKTPTMLPEVPTASDEVPYPTEPPTSFSSLVTDLAEDGAGKPFIDPEVVIQALAGNRYLQLASGLDRPHLLRRFMVEWSTETALRDSVERLSGHDIVRPEGLSPFLKISPALMHIDNVSLASLGRTNRSIGVGDLREALGGRGSMSNPTLNMSGPPSVSTFENSSVGHGGDHAVNSQVFARTAAKRKTLKGKPGEVRDVLNKLGVGKQNGSSLLMTPFSASPNQAGPRTTSILVPPYHS